MQKMRNSVRRHADVSLQRIYELVIFMEMKIPKYVTVNISIVIEIAGRIVYLMNQGTHLTILTFVYDYITNCFNCQAL